MTIQCRVTIDENQFIEDVTFQAVPRIGESVSMAGDTTSLRVSRVVHLPEGASQEALIVVELTSKIL
ncbi:hypothetical protein LHFGNBLO_005842 [Mesorhizobium sp. AR10]|nr:hypothetical protein LHFGNBLO_005842 [Mesorhizobium sp. AR10]